MDEAGDNPGAHGRKQPSSEDALRTWPLGKGLKKFNPL